MTILNPADFGAVGDGIVDDRPAIQAALDAAAGTGGVVHLAAGTYFIGNGLLVPSGVTLEGSGVDTILRTPGGDLWGHNVEGQLVYAAVALVGVTGAGVRNLTIDLATNQTHANGVLLGWSGDGTLTTNAVVEGVHIEGWNTHQYLIWNYRGQDNVIRDNTLNGNVAPGTASEQEGIEIYGGANIVVSGNVVTNVGSNSLYAWEDPVPGSQTGLHNIQFIDNMASGGAVGVRVVVQNEASNIVISGNHVSGESADGIFISSEPNAVLSNASVVGNTISHVAGLGIWLADYGGDWSSVLVHGNTISDISRNYGTGIYVTAENVDIDANTINNTVYSGIYFSNASNASASGNIIVNAGDLPIHVETANSAGVSLEGNVAVQSGASAPTASLALSSADLGIDHPSTDVSIRFSAPVAGFGSANLALPTGVTASPLVSTDGGQSWHGTLTAAAGVEIVSGTVSINLDHAWIDATGAPVSIAVSAPIAVHTMSGELVVGTAGNDALTSHHVSDTLSGGAGDDTYYITSPDVVVSEAAGGGTDAILTTTSYRLPDAVEVEYVHINTAASGLTLVGNDLGTWLDGNIGSDSLVGGSGNDVLTGGGGGDVLIGGAGQDILDGGAAGDVMSGGQGNDTYFVDNPGDVVREQTGEGVDVVLAKSDWVMETGQSIEVVQVIDAAGAHISGNELSNRLIGGSGNDTLEGGGGNDILDGRGGDNVVSGGTGDDLYEVNTSGDVVLEAAGEGYDTVVATVSWTMTPGQEIEAVVVQSSAGLKIIGNTYSNVIVGDVGADWIDGGGGNDVLDGRAGNDVLRGAEGNDTIDGGAGADLMYGGGGNDTFHIDNAGDTVIERPDGGTDTIISTIDYRLEAGSEIEILRADVSAHGLQLTGDGSGNEIDGGMGNDRLFGGGGNDTLTGGSGNDLLYGGSSAAESPDAAGINEMHGGTGSDTYYVNNTADRVVEAPGEGDDAVLTTVSYTLAPGQEIEYAHINTSASGLTLTGNESGNWLDGNVGDDVLRGAGGNDMMTGGDGQDVLQGGEGNDTLDGGSGADRLEGGGGDDVYFVDNPGDVVVESVGGGSDRVLATSDWSAGAGQAIETIEAISSVGLHLAGNEFANRIFGNAGSDTLDGGAGDDLLYGMGGADVMRGGAGNDTYYVDNAGDQVVEAPGEGADAVLTTVSYTLAPGQEIEYAHINTSASGLTLTGNESGNWLDGNVGDDVLKGAGGHDYMTGGDGQDVLQGGEGNDTLDGGSGADRLEGGGGDDVYFVDNPGDVVVESNDGGSDRVLATSNWSAGAGQAIETIEAISSAGLHLAGNEFANRLFGQSGNDSLDGGAGDDLLYGMGGVNVMRGGTGNDTYYVGNASDQVIEAAGGGVDTVQATVSFTLGQGQEIEYAHINSSASGLSLTGNEFANWLDGNVGNDVLQGGGGNDTLSGGDGDDRLLGGAGNNLLIGGTGHDTFAFGDPWGADTIADFQVGMDMLAFDRAKVPDFSHLSIVQQGNNTVVSYGESSITLYGVNANQITADSTAFILG